jgi:hypothetical protein
VVDCETYLEVLGRLDEIARTVGARDFVELLQFPFGDLVRAAEASPGLFRLVLAVTVLIREMLYCRERAAGAGRG